MVTELHTESSVGLDTESAKWIRRYYDLCETDIEGAMDFWAPEGVVKFANFEAKVGKEAILATFKEWIAMWETETHTLVNLWEEPGGVVIFELDVAFGMHDGTKIAVRGMAYNRIEGGLLHDQRVYVDLGLVWAAAAAQGSASAVVSA